MKREPRRSASPTGFGIVSFKIPLEDSLMTNNIHKYSSEMPYEQLLHHLDDDESDQSDLSELVETDAPV
jgi:hypothetical protein